MITLQSPTKNGAALIKYLINDKGGHDGSEERNLYVDTVNLMPSKDANGYIRQFKKEWKYAGLRHRNQARHLIISPADSEIDYDNPDNVMLLAEICKEYLKQHYPNRRCLICIQQDGKGYKDDDGNIKKVLHAHCVVSDCDLDTYKGVETEKTGYKYLNRTFIEFVRDRYGIEIYDGKSRKKRRYLQKQLLNEGQKDEHGKYYSYQDDIKDRIDRCAAACKTLQEFWGHLKDFGLSVSHKNMKKNDTQYQTYSLLDLSNISDSSKDKDGNIRKLARKEGQLPSMRSYKHHGYSAEDIGNKISSANNCVKTVKDTDRTEKDAHAERNSSQVQLEFLRQLSTASEKALKESKKKDEIKAQTKKRHKAISNEINIEKSKDYSL